MTGGVVRISNGMWVNGLRPRFSTLVWTRGVVETAQVEWTRGGFQLYHEGHGRAMLSHSCEPP
jgi:hypothetical protein